MAEITKSAEAELEHMQQLVLAANTQFAQGDATPLPALCSHEDVTLFGGASDYEHGWE